MSLVRDRLLGGTAGGFVTNPVPSLSAVAAIHDHGDGMRVVVAAPSEILLYHVGKNERSYIVPDLWVVEPVPWDRVPYVVDRANRYLLSQLAPKNLCGECSVCCVTPHLKTQEFEKPSHHPCPKLFRSGCGCSEYWRRPLQCQTFKCLWLSSQDSATPMDADLRPDRAGVMLTGPEQGQQQDQIWIHPPHKVDRARREVQCSPEMRSFLQARAEAGSPIGIVTHYFLEGGAAP